MRLVHLELMAMVLPSLFKQETVGLAELLGVRLALQPGRLVVAARVACF